MLDISFSLLPVFLLIALGAVLKRAGFPGDETPVIRGQSGPRVRVLQNGLDTFDAACKNFPGPN